MSQNNSLVPIRFALGTVSSFGNSAYQIAAEKDIMKRGRDYIGVGVGAVIVDSKGRLLLVLRGPKAQNQQNLWEFPGGSVEFNERHQDALKREMKEELGVDVEVEGFLDVVDDILPEEGQHWISPNYICRIVSGQPSIQPGEAGKVLKFCWYHPADVPANITNVTRQILADYRARQRCQRPTREYTVPF